MNSTSMTNSDHISTAVPLQNISPSQRQPNSQLRENEGRQSFPEKCNAAKSEAESCFAQPQDEAEIRTSRKKVIGLNPGPSYNVPTPLGFRPNEFLPFFYQTDIDRRKKRRIREKEEESGLNLLSDDVLGSCFFSGYVDSLQKVRLTQVNRRFQRAASQQVHKLDLSNCKHLTTKDITNIVARFPYLEDLDFSYCSQLGDRVLPALIPLSKTLKHLTLKGTTVSDIDLANYFVDVQCSGSTSRLESLDLSAVEARVSRCIGALSVQAISESCPNLKTLRLAWRKEIDNQCVGRLATLPKLSKLDLSLTGITSGSAHHLRQMMPRLQALDISATRVLDQDENSPHGEDNVIFPPGSPLKALKLRFMRNMEANQLMSIASALPSLKFLDASYSGEDQRLEIPPTFSKACRQRGVRLVGTWDSPSADSSS